MTRDEIINLMHETECLDEGHYGSLWMERFERFAALVAAAEREACAKACKAQKTRIVARHPARIDFDPDSVMTQKCAAAIRARGQA